MQWTFDVAMKEECRVLAEERYNGARFEDLDPTYQRDIRAEAEDNVIARAERESA